MKLLYADEAFISEHKKWIALGTVMRKLFIVLLADSLENATAILEVEREYGNQRLKSKCRQN